MKRALTVLAAVFVGVPVSAFIHKALAESELSAFETFGIFAGCVLVIAVIAGVVQQSKLPPAGPNQDKK